MNSSGQGVKAAYIGIGSNVGERLSHCLACTERIRHIEGCTLTGVSDWYLTRPVGVEGQEWYVNGVASVVTEIPAGGLLQRLLTIESVMGRIRRDRWESRIIDLDLLLYGQEVIHEGGLSVPHPLMHLRRFVLVPLVQLASELRHPLLGKTMGEILKDLRDEDQEVIRIEGYR